MTEEPRAACPGCGRMSILTAVDGRRCLACTLPENGVCPPSGVFLDNWEAQAALRIELVKHLPRVTA